MLGLKLLPQKPVLAGRVRERIFKVASKFALSQMRTRNQTQAKSAKIKGLANMHPLRGDSGGVTLFSVPGGRKYSGH